jgi:hypothetical protein
MWLGTPLDITDLGVSRCFLVDDSPLWSLHRADLDCATDVSEVHTASIFRVEVSEVSSLMYLYVDDYWWAILGHYQWLNNTASNGRKTDE